MLTRAWLSFGCTVIEETYSFVYTCNNMFVYFHRTTFIECLLKVWVLAHSYYVMVMTKEIPLNSALAVRPKTESSGLEVEAKLGFQY